MLKKTITVGFLLILVMAGQSCATKQQTKADPTSSKFVYSLMMKDSVALESIFNDDLKKNLKGDMLIKAVKSVGKGDMKGIIMTDRKDNLATYDIKMKDGVFPLKLQMDKYNKIEKIWIKDQELAAKR